MNNLGIEPSGDFVVEGAEYGARYLVSRPVLTMATVITCDADYETVQAVVNLQVTKLLFREEQFEPVTRIRRGRLYKGGGSQPRPWHRVQHPDGPVDLSLCTFQPVSWDSVCDGAKSYRRLVLGTKNSCSSWDVVMIENAVGGGDLLTLRALTTFGLLPEAKNLNIPGESVQRVQKTLNAAVDAAHRQMADATVDACRHAAVAALGAWLKPNIGEKSEHTDLGELLKFIENDSMLKVHTVLISAARIINRLHPRTKPNELKKLGLRPNSDMDGESAISVLGLLLREIESSPDSSAA